MAEVSSPDVIDGLGSRTNRFVECVSALLHPVRLWALCCNGRAPNFRQILLSAFYHVTIIAVRLYKICITCSFEVRLHFRLV